MRLKQILSCAFIAFSLLHTAYATEKKLESTTKLLQKSLDETRAKYKFSAMALTIIDPRLSSTPMNFVSGSTQKIKGRALLPSDYFQIGSNTKSFVAALLIKLQSEGLLSLKDPITKWLPQYPKWKNVRILNLLHNNSGIENYTKSEAFLKFEKKYPAKEFTSEELIRYAYEKPQLFEAGKGWDYSNSNWVLAGMIAEKVTGKNLADLFNQYFFAKNRLNLSNTIYWPTQYNCKIFARMVHGYDDKGKDITARNMSWASSAGAIIATNEDLARWTDALFHGKALTKNELAIMQDLVSTKTGKPLVGKKSKVPEKDQDPLGYGLGVGMRLTQGLTWWGHEGQTEGFHSLFAWFPEKDVSVAMHANGLKEADFKPVMVKIINILDAAKSKTKKE